MAPLGLNYDFKKIPEESISVLLILKCQLIVTVQVTRNVHDGSPLSLVFQVDDPSLPNDEGITALHNAVCAGHTEIVKFLVQFGVNVNAADSDGW